MQSALYPWQEPNWSQWQKQGQRISHAYLLSGVPGIGLEVFAQRMAQGLLCQAGAQHLEPCGQCHACHLAATDQHPDYYQVEIAEDKKEITIDQIRELTQKLYETSHQGGYKVAVILEAERMNTPAFNALLKSLEEPPEKTVLILTTFQANQLPATILSRCQKLNFQPPLINEAAAWLQQQAPNADEALIKKALRARYGAPLAALQWMEQKGYERHQQWQNDCQALKQGKKSVPEVVAGWLKWDEPEEVFHAFYQWAVTASRQALYQQKRPYTPDLMTFQAVALQAKTLWGKNVNKALLLENLCLVWLAMDTPQFQTLAKPFKDLK
jgi:DNA polymerase-3 subunit delta'